VKFAITMLAAMWLVLMAASWAEGAQAVANEEYSFNWLDPDKKIYVLQNRKYLKAKRLLLSAMAGVGSSNPYRTTYTVQPRVAFYLSEMFGIEMFYAGMLNRENATFRALTVAAPNTLPVVREIRAEYGGLIHYVPWYAKINVFNKILYFDWYFSGGGGIVQSSLDTRKSASLAATYTDKNLSGVFFGTGHQYHLSHNLTVRLDMTGTAYRAPLSGDSGAETWFSTYLFGLGLGLRL